MQEMYVFFNVAMYASLSVCVCVCVCVFFSFILDVKFVGCTSRGHTSSTFLLRCMHFFFSREGFSRSFPSSNVKLFGGTRWSA